MLLAVLIATLQPLPSRHLAMATGPPGSVYAQAAERYRDILAHDGVKLRLVPTNGAVDNIRLLRDPRRGRGGIRAVRHRRGGRFEGSGVVGNGLLRGGVVLLPLPGGTLTTIKDLASWTVSIGPEGGADRPLALKLLALNGMDPQQLKLVGLSRG